MKLINLFLAGLASAITFTAAAQQSTTSVTILPHKCEKPVGGPGVDPNYDQQQRFQKKVDAYKECINKYVAEMRTQADQHLEITKKYQDSGNAAVSEYNAYVTDLNAQYGSKGKDENASSVKPSTPPTSIPGKKY